MLLSKIGLDDNIDKKISMSEYFKKINKEELKKELKKVLWQYLKLQRRG